MKKKIILPIMFLVITLFAHTLCVSGEELEWYDLQEVIDDSEVEWTSDENTSIVPYARYILGAKVILRQPSSDVIMMRSEVYCTETMRSIKTVFTLQKKVGNSWINVGQGTVSTSNDNSMYKSMQATGVSSGTYRCIADTQVVSRTGYAESVSVISAEI